MAQRADLEGTRPGRDHLTFRAPESEDSPRTKAFDGEATAIHEFKRETIRLQKASGKPVDELE